MFRMEVYDLLVVGAGPGGCIAAKTASRLGLKVLILERLPRERVGDKVCGDAVGRHHFDELALSYPKGDELALRIKGIDVFSPDGEVRFRVEGEGLHGFMINRLFFGQRLLNEALNAGAELMDKVLVEDVVVKDGYVVGVRGRRDGFKVEFKGRLTIDASGYVARLRRRLPREWGFEEVADEDMVSCYREIRLLDGEVEDPDYCKVYLSHALAPGGYIWVFPKGGRVVNAGLGVQMRSGFPNPRILFSKAVLGREGFRGSKLIHGGGGVVPTRRPLNCLVANGFMVVGDAACQANPLHGGGIGPSMRAGSIAARVAAEALRRGDVSREGLWGYNVEYAKNYGAKQAGLDLFRMLLQSISDEDINYGMKHRLITEQDLLKASMGDRVRLNLTEKVERLFKGVGRLSLLRRLEAMSKAVDSARSLYQAYPPPSGFIEWCKNVEGLIEGYRRALKG